MSRPPRYSPILTPQGLEGCILFLKKIENITSYHRKKYDVESSAFWHPVLVLQIDEATDEATVCILTTLNDCDAEDRIPSSDCHLYLAVWPKHPPFSGQPQLKLQGNATFRRPGYISIRREYLVHQFMLQPYDWNEPTNYYRLTQKSFAVVVAKLDSIYYSTRLAKVNAEDFARKVAKSRLKESASKAAELNANVMRLMASRDSLAPSQPRTDHQPDIADSRAPSAAASIEAVQARAKPRIHIAIAKILLVYAVLVTAMICVRSRKDPAWGEWPGGTFEKLTEVWMMALATLWGDGRLIAASLWKLGKVIAAWGGWLIRRMLSASLQVLMAAWKMSGVWIQAVYRALAKAVKELMDGGGLPAGLLP